MTPRMSTRRSTAASGHKEPPNDHSSPTEGQRQHSVRSPRRSRNTSPKQPRKQNGRPAAGRPHHTQRRQMASHPQMLQQLLTETDTDQRHAGPAPRPPHPPPRSTATRHGTRRRREPKQKMRGHRGANDHNDPGRARKVRVRRVQPAIRMPTPTRVRAKPMQTQRRGRHEHHPARNRARRTHGQKTNPCPGQPQTSLGAPASAPVGGTRALVERHSRLTRGIPSTSLGHPIGESRFSPETPGKWRQMPNARHRCQSTRTRLQSRKSSPETLTAAACHAEGRGFESLQPLQRRPAFAGLFRARLVRPDVDTPTS
jgi:hypothetical protein